METWEAIRSRRNVRSFEDRPVPEDHLNEILEAGRRAPSSQNWQPWSFVVVTERERLVKLAQVWQGAGHVAHSAATVALVASLPSAPSQPSQLERRRGTLYYDLGQATMSIMLAAAGLGIGTAHAGVGDQDMARSLLGFPDDRFCAYLISLGYPAGRPLTPIKNPDRRPFDEVVHRDHW